MFLTLESTVEVLCGLRKPALPCYRCLVVVGDVVFLLLSLLAHGNGSMGFWGLGFRFGVWGQDGI